MKVVVFSINNIKKMFWD